LRRADLAAGFLPQPVDMIPAEGRDDKDPGIVLARNRRGQTKRSVGSLRTVVAKHDGLDIPILHLSSSP